MRSQAIIRIRIITAIVLLLAFALLTRLYTIQVVHSHMYEEQASQQYIHTAQNIFNRGSIYFTTKHDEQVSAASIRSGYVLAVNPTRIQSSEEVYDQLSPYIDIPKELFLTRATLPNRTYVEIAQQVTQDTAAEIQALDLTGVMLYRNQWRYYPGNALASQTIGFVGYGGDVEDGLRGRYGLERHYDDVLRRNDDSLSVNFFAEIFTNLGSLVTKDDNAQQGNVVTTLEPTVSHMMESVLQELHEEYSSVYTGGIIMDPSTGAIYAMSSYPTYNNNDRSSVTIDRFNNPLVQNVEEFGSIVKALTIAAGLDGNVITPSTEYYDAGYIELDRATIRNFDGRGRGTVDMQVVLNQSLNTGVSYIVDQLGTGRFRDYFFDLGLSEKTGIDLPNEASGLVSNLQSPRRVEYATASFGQGIAVTPVAMVRALAALGNGGHLVTPHVVSQIEYSNGTTASVTPTDRPQVFRPETSEAISRMLTNVVDDALRGGGVALPNHTIAAKTGTAQIPDPLNGGYYDDRFLHSFFGYFPAYEPQFIVLLYTIDPKGVRYASETLTEPFMDITNFLINYYQVPPDR